MASKINVAPIDRYTSAHAGMGALTARAGFPWWGALLASVGWELAENGIKKRFPDLFPDSSVDSIPNAVVDTAAFMVGWAAASHALKQAADTSERVALRAAAGTAVGGAAGSVVFGLAGGHGLRQDINLARLGYRIGGAVGGATASLLAKDGFLVAAAAALGAAIIGPVGAAAGAYVAAPRETA